MASYIGNTPQATFLVSKRQEYEYNVTNQQTFTGADDRGESLIIPALSDVLVFKDGVLIPSDEYATGLNTVVFLAPVSGQIIIITEVQAALVNAFTRNEAIAEIDARFNTVVNSIDLDQLADVDLTTNAPTSGQTIIWNGTQFVPGESFSSAEFDTTLATKTTDDLAEGSTNLYYTDTRANSAIDARVTQAFVEALNITITQAQITDLNHYNSTDFDTDLATKSTDDLAEGSTNLYYTDTRVRSVLTADNIADTSYVDTAIANLVDTAPTTLDTLNELAAALGDDPNFASTITTALGTKLATADFTTTLNTNSIDELSDVDTTTAAASNGDALVWNGTNWVPQAPFSQADFDTAFGNKTTTDLTEGTNLYYTDARADARIATASVGDLSDVDITSTAPTANQALIWDTVNSKFIPGDSFSQADFDTAFTAKDTDDLSEGSANLYYTDGRVQTVVTKTYVEGLGIDYSSLTNPPTIPGDVSDLTDTTGLLDQNAVTFGTTAPPSPSSGDLWYNETVAELFVYDGSNWITTADGVGDFFADKTTDDLTEGSTNLYYTDARVQSYLTANNVGAEVNDLTANVTWANVPDANITQSSVTQHQAALSITESQISDLQAYITDYTVTQADVTQHQAALSITESQISDLQTYLTSETTTSLSLATNILTYTDETGTDTDIDLSLYLDDTNLAYIVSGAVDANTGIATFTRDDATSFTVDFSAFLDDTNLTRIDSAAFANGTLTLTRGGDSTTVTVNLDGRYLQDLSAQDTDDLAEGATNLYYTNARVQGVVTQAYVEGLNINSTAVGYTNEHATDLTATNVHDAIDQLNAIKANVADIASNVILYPTTAASDVTGYSRLVTSTDDTDYNTTAVNVSTGAISTSAFLISSLVSDANIISGNPGVVNLSVIGNIRKVSGNANAHFYFEVYKRDASGTETLLSTSSQTETVTSTTYEQFAASALLNDGDFLDTDRIVYKFYGVKEGTNTDPVYNFQFGGGNPIRALLPLPFSAVPTNVDSSNLVIDTTNFDGLLAGSQAILQDALDTIDDLQLGANTTIDTTAPTSPSSGDLWYDTTVGELFVYDGAAWFSTADGVGDFFAENTTDNLTEGSTNLYYTDTRSRNAISASGDLSYDANTGVISFSAAAAPVTSVNSQTGAVSLDTDDISEGTTNLYHTDARVQAVIDTNTAGFITGYTVTESDVTAHQAALSITESQISDFQSYLTSETTTSLSINANVLTFTDETGTPTNIDLSLYLDDTNLARLVSGSIDPNTGIATFTRDDASTFTVDYSAFLDDTNLTRIDSAAFNTTDGVLTLTRGGDSSTITVDLDGRYALAGDVFSGAYADLTGAPTAVSAFTNDSGYITGYTVTETDVTTHQAALSITESQISDLVHYTDADARAHIEGQDLDLGTNKVLYSNVYPTLGDLPDATSYHGMFAHVHAEGKGYFAHAGSWVELANASSLFDGDYNSLSNLPSLFDGAYSSLTGAPTIPSSIDDLSDVDVSTAAPTNGQALVWNGTNFVPGTVAAEGGSSVTVSDTAPSSPSEGDMWFDSANLVMMVYYDGFWIEPTSIADSHVVQVSESIPTAAVENSLWWNSTDGNLYVYYNDGDSLQWVQANSTDISLTLNDIVNVDTTGAVNGNALVFDGTNWVAGQGGTDLSTADTDDLSEGSTNLYYTDTRVDTRITSQLTHFHSAFQIVTSQQATDNETQTVDFTFAELADAVHYQVYINRILLRPTEVTVSGTTLTCSLGLLTTDDEIEVVGLSY